MMARSGNSLSEKKNFETSKKDDYCDFLNLQRTSSEMDIFLVNKQRFLWVFAWIFAWEGAVGITYYYIIIIIYQSLCIFVHS